MNASSDFQTTNRLAASHTHRFGQTLLLANGAILAIVASASVLFDVAGHFFGLGPFAIYEGNFDSIAFVEAHGLALIVAVLLLIHRDWPTARWNWVAAATHALLGSANLMFWPIFAANSSLTLGYLTTAMHLVFVALHLIACTKAFSVGSAPAPTRRTS